MATPKRQFVVYTQDMVGLGWAKKLQEEGEDVTLALHPDKKEEDLDKFKKVGKGWIKKIVPFGQAPTGPNVYHIFDDNHLSELADKLRGKGQKVFGTSKLSADLEYDRKLAVDMAKKAGLDVPETKEFTTTQEGMKFLDANSEKAYVFKPDSSEYNYLTFVPVRDKNADANREVFHYLSHTDFKGPYILQERVYGVEVNVEAWMFEGRPFFATATWENKRKSDHDTGEMAGCSGDVICTVPLEGELVKRTVGKMFSYYKAQKYTGFADVNVIISDNKTYFLEVCNRFGYNAHPNLFLALGLDGFGSIIADFIDGKVDGMYKRFRPGFGASVSVYIDHPREGLPLHVREEWEKKFFPFDGYKEGEDLLLTGYSPEVGIFCDYDYTLTSAVEVTYQKLLYNEAVSFPDIYYRMDLGKFDYINAPAKRHEALRRMSLIS